MTFGPSGVHSPDQNLHIYVQLTPWPYITLSSDIREQEREMWDFFPSRGPSLHTLPGVNQVNYAVLGVLGYFDESTWIVCFIQAHQCFRLQAGLAGFVEFKG